MALDDSGYLKVLDDSGYLNVVDDGGYLKVLGESGYMRFLQLSPKFLTTIAVAIHRIEESLTLNREAYMCMCTLFPSKFAPFNFRPPSVKLTTINFRPSYRSLIFSPSFSI